MIGYRALGEAVSMLKRYGREVARLLNQEHEDPDILRGIGYTCLGGGFVGGLRAWGWLLGRAGRW